MEINENPSSLNAGIDSQKDVQQLTTHLQWWLRYLHLTTQRGKNCRATDGGQQEQNQTSQALLIPDTAQKMEIANPFPGGCLRLDS